MKGQHPHDYKISSVKPHFLENVNSKATEVVILPTPALSWKIKGSYLHQVKPDEITVVELIA